MASSAALDRNCAGMFVRCTSSTRSCSERWLSSRVVATLLAIVPLLLLEPTRRPLLSGGYGYASSSFHRIGGDFVAQGGKCREARSTYGPRLADENPKLKIQRGDKFQLHRIFISQSVVLWDRDIWSYLTQ